MNHKYVGNDKIGRECHKQRKFFELNLNKSNDNDLKRKIYKNFAKLNIGREIILIGRIVS